LGTLALVNAGLAQSERTAWG